MLMRNSDGYESWRRVWKKKYKKFVSNLNSFVFADLNLQFNFLIHYT